VPSPSLRCVLLVATACLAGFRTSAAYARQSPGPFGILLGSSGLSSRMNYIDRFLSLVLVAVAIGLLITLWRPTSTPDDSNGRETYYVPEWQAIADSGRWSGPRDAAVVLVVFGDYECPFCARFESTLAPVVDSLGPSIAPSHIHFPLERIHRFAVPAAAAAECAAPHGRFQEFHRLLYEQRDSLGLKTWTSFAGDAGIGDLTEFEDCLSSDLRPGAIDQGLRIGESIGVRATPSVLINGWFFHGAMTRPHPLQVIETVLDGGEPA
jgi:predicted DsbA family dithiol-disulfide isomerase